jgi:tetratricopeptide (TPR) repeat protein
MIKIMIFLSLFCLGQISYAEPNKLQGPDSIFLKASLYYKAAQYDEAIAQYYLLIRQGVESGSLFYNLGNCYLKKGQFGKAILNYERAKRIIPSDADLIANNQYARSLIKGASPQEATAWDEKIFERSLGRLSPDGLIIFLSAIYTLFMIILITRTYSIRMRKYSLAVIAILLALFILGSLSFYEKVSAIGKEAITMTDKADVKFQPFEKAPFHFALYEGMKIRILRIEGDWVKILTPDKKTGWIQVLHIEVI